MKAHETLELIASSLQALIDRLPELDRTWMAGYRAGQDGKPDTENPFGPGDGPPTDF